MQEMNGRIQYSNAMAITVRSCLLDLSPTENSKFKSALFAGALFTLAQLIAGYDTNTTSWAALRFFTYSAIVLSLNGTFMGLLCIDACAHLQRNARLKLLADSDSWPGRVARGETLPREILTNNVELLRVFGISRGFETTESIISLSLLFAFIFTITSVTLWVWLSQTYVVAGLITITIGAAITVTTYALFNQEP
jgi:hypothetical protein